jgi:hypothetical protein
MHIVPLPHLVRDLMDRLAAACEAEEINLALAASRYSSHEDTDPAFETRLVLHPTLQAGIGVSQDHAFLDLQRELMVEWSNSRHAGQLVWSRGDRSH